jgi:Sulfotransferase family
MEIDTPARWIRTAGRAAIRAGAMATADLRPHPDLVVIGVKRGGTTSLFRDLEHHRAMCPLVPSARRLPMRENMKGVHYFDGDMNQSMRWYRSHFPTTLTRRVRRRRVGASFTAEASPYYFFHPLAAERAAARLATTTFVVMLRDPVERTVSHWAEQTRNGVETLSLADALAAESDRVGDDRARLAAGTLANSTADEQQSYAAQSEYAASYDRWVDAVGAERIIVIFAEEYYADPFGTVSVLTDALGVGPPPLEAVGAHRNAAPRPGRIDPDLDARLTERFRPDVDLLTERLGRTPPWPRFGAPRSMSVDR